MTLATAVDVSIRLNRELSDDELAQVEALLADTSAAVRSYTGQQFDLVANDTMRVRVRNGVVYLPQRPVGAIGAVTDGNGNEVAYAWDGFDKLDLGILPVDGFERNLTLASSTISWVDVTYDHGYAAVPDDIVGVVCQIVGRAFGSPADRSGITQESLGAYSVSLGGTAAAGPFGLLAAERAVLDRYRKPVGNIRVAYP